MSPTGSDMSGQRIECVIPLRIRLRGRPDAAVLQELAAALKRQVAARLAQAEAEIGRRPRTGQRRCYHLPVQARWRVAEAPFADALDRGSISGLVLGAIESVLTEAASDSSVRRVENPDARPAERLDPTRWVAGNQTYAGGSPTSIPRLLHPQAEPDRDQLIDRPSPLAGHHLLRLPGGAEARLADRRHARFGDLARALDFGRAAFDGSAFAVLEGPYPVTAQSRYTLAPIEVSSGQRLDRGALEAAPPDSWCLEMHDDAGEPHLLRAVIDAEGDMLAPPDPSFLSRELQAELAAARPRAANGSGDRAVPLETAPAPSTAHKTPTAISIGSTGKGTARSNTARSNTASSNTASSNTASSNTVPGGHPMILLEPPIRLAWLEALLASRLEPIRLHEVLPLLTSFGTPESLRAALVSLRRSSRLSDVLTEPRAAFTLLLHVGSVFDESEPSVRLDLPSLLGQAGFPLSQRHPVLLEAHLLDLALRRFGPALGLEAGMARVLALDDLFRRRKKDHAAARRLDALVTAAPAEVRQAWRGLLVLDPPAADGRHIAWLVVWGLAAALEEESGEPTGEPWPIAMIVE